jgi:hypothetical protein
VEILYLYLVNMSVTEEALKTAKIHRRSAKATSYIDPVGKSLDCSTRAKENSERGKRSPC